MYSTDKTVPGPGRPGVEWRCSSHCRTRDRPVSLYGDADGDEDAGSQADAGEGVEQPTVLTLSTLLTTLKP